MDTRLAGLRHGFGSWSPMYDPYANVDNKLLILIQSRALPAWRYATLWRRNSLAISFLSWISGQDGTVYT